MTSDLFVFAYAVIGNLFVFAYADIGEFMFYIYADYCMSDVNKY